MYNIESLLINYYLFNGSFSSYYLYFILFEKFIIISIKEIYQKYGGLYIWYIWSIGNYWVKDQTIVILVDLNI